MLRLIAVIHKELLLLLRDKGGLLVLFVMPAVLVVVITLVQENALKTIGESGTRILLIDDDRQALGQQIIDTLTAADGVILSRFLDGKFPERSRAMRAVAKGQFQICLILPQGLTETVRARARQSARQSLLKKLLPTDLTESPPSVEVYFDPAVLGGFRSAFKNMLNLMVLQLTVREKMAALAQLLPEQINQSLEEALAPVSNLVPQLPRVDFQIAWSDLKLLAVKDGVAMAQEALVAPTSVQQNVPAWSLFGIFFIVLPMAGAFIKERLNGTHQRLMTLPVPHITLVGGRVCAYALICLMQCALIGLIGKWLLPLLGTSHLEMGNAPLALLAVAASAILAATGYGILLGTMVNSYEQAAMFGSISIVIAAALGGVMVPVYAMPTMMQKISALSPLAWGLNACLDIFVRGGGLGDVLPEIGYLLGFFVTCILMASIWRQYRYRTGESMAD